MKKPEKVAAYRGPKGELYDSAEDASNAFAREELLKMFVMNKQEEGRGKVFILEDLKTVYEILKKHMGDPNDR